MEYLHHRKRLREHFKQVETLPPYQLLELLLTFVLPRVDTKPLAKELLKKFDSLNKIFTTDRERLLEVNGIGERTVDFLKCIYQVVIILQQEKMKEERNLELNVEQIAKYTMFKIGNETKEHLIVFLFDARKKLIKEYFHSTGTLSYNPIYLRELVKEILLFQTAYVVMCHNHPSKDYTPSVEDIKITRKIHLLLKDFQIFLYDHLIVSCNGYSSMKNLNLF